MKYFGRLAGSTAAENALLGTTPAAHKTPFDAQSIGTKLFAYGEHATSVAMNRVAGALQANIEYLAGLFDSPAVREDILGPLITADPADKMGGTRGFPALSMADPSLSAYVDLGADDGAGSEPPAAWVYVGMSRGALSAGNVVQLHGDMGNLSSGGAIAFPTDVYVAGVSYFDAAADLTEQASLAALTPSSRTFTDKLPPIDRVQSEIEPYAGGALSIAIDSWEEDGPVLIAGKTWAQHHARPGVYVEIVSAGGNSGLYQLRSSSGRKAVLTRGSLLEVEVTNPALFTAGQLVSWADPDDNANGLTLDARPNKGHVMFKTAGGVLYITRAAQWDSMGAGSIAGSYVSNEIAVAPLNVPYVVNAFNEPGLVEYETGATSNATLRVGTFLYPEDFSSLADAVGTTVTSISGPGYPLKFDTTETGDAYVCSPPGFLLNPSFYFIGSVPTTRPAGNYNLLCRTLTTVRERASSSGMSISKVGANDPTSRLPGGKTDLMAVATQSAIYDILTGEPVPSAGHLYYDSWYTGAKNKLGRNTWRIRAVSGGAVGIGTKVTDGTLVQGDPIEVVTAGGYGSTWCEVVTGWQDYLVVKNVSRAAWTDLASSVDYSAAVTSITVTDVLTVAAVPYTVTAIIYPKSLDAAAAWREDPPLGLNAAYSQALAGSSLDRLPALGSRVLLATGSPIVLLSNEDPFVGVSLRNKLETKQADLGLDLTAGSLTLGDTNTGGTYIKLSSAADTVLPERQDDSLLGVLSDLAETQLLTDTAVTKTDILATAAKNEVDINAFVAVHQGLRWDIPDELPYTITPGYAGNPAYIYWDFGVKAFGDSADLNMAAANRLYLAKVTNTDPAVPPASQPLVVTPILRDASFINKKLDITVGNAVTCDFKTVTAALDFIGTYVNDGTSDIPDYKIKIVGDIVESGNTPILMPCQNITIEGTDNTDASITWNTNGPLFDLNGQTRLSFRNFRVDCTAAGDPDADTVVFYDNAGTSAGFLEITGIYNNPAFQLAGFIDIASTNFLGNITVSNCRIWTGSFGISAIDARKIECEARISNCWFTKINTTIGAKKDVIYFSGVPKVFVREAYVYTAMDAGDTGMGLRIHDGLVVVVADSHVENVQGEGINVNAFTERGLITNTTVSDSGTGSCVDVENSANFTIENSVFGTAALDVVRLVSCSRCTVKNNKLSAGTDYGVQIYKSTDCVVEGNTFSGCASNDVFVDFDGGVDCINTRIINNVCQSGTGILVETGNSNAVITGNEVLVNTVNAGIECGGSKAVISSNKINGDADADPTYGVHSGGSLNIISDNVIYGLPVSATGIFVGDEYCLIRGNIVRGDPSLLYGIYVDASNTTVTGNSVFSSDIGIFQHQNAGPTARERITITGNQLADVFHGIWFDYVNIATVVGNTIGTILDATVGNDFESGITLVEATNVMMTGNNITLDTTPSASGIIATWAAAGNKGITCNGNVIVATGVAATQGIYMDPTHYGGVAYATGIIIQGNHIVNTTTAVTIGAGANQIYVVAENLQY